MRKVEAVHLHALLDELRGYLEARGKVEREAFTDYDGLGILPLQVHRSKSEHAEALLVLGDTLATELSARYITATEDDRSSERTSQRTNGDR